MHKKDEEECSDSDDWMLREDDSVWLEPDLGEGKVGDIVINVFFDGQTVHVKAHRNRNEMDEPELAGFCLPVGEIKR